MTNHKHLTRLMHRAAQQAAPDDLDLWPGIRARLGPLSTPNTRHVPGMLTAAAATLFVFFAALIFLVTRDAGDSSHGAASRAQVTPTVSPPAQMASSPDRLCEQYPAYCVPFVGGVGPDDLMVNVESPANFRAQTMHGSAAGVVRGAIPDGLLFLGNPAAAARFEVALDFGCPHCVTFYRDTLEALINDYVLAGTAALQVRITPATDAALAGQVALCAGEQGAFWEMTARLLALEDSDPLLLSSQSGLVALAEEMGLDAGSLNACIDSGRYLDVLDRNRQSLLEDDEAAVPTIWYVDKLSGERLKLTDRSLDALARFVTAAQEQQGITVLDTVDVASSSFTAGGIYIDENELGLTKPREYYHVTEANDKFYEELAAADGWALLTARGEHYVPTLTIAQLIQSGTAPVNTSYRAYDGVLLFNWLNNTHFTDPDQYAQISYDVMVDDSKYSSPGDYTLTLRPLGEVIDLSAGAQAITLDYDTPQVVRFQSSQERPVHLTIETVSYTTPEQVMPGVLVEEPEIAVLLPYGETLTTFQPGRASRLEMDFTLPSDREPFLVFNLLPDTLAETERRVIVLRVAVAQTTVTSPVVIPPDKVAVTIPDSAFMVVGGSLQEGQRVAVIGSFPIIEGDADFSMTNIIGPDMEPTKVVTQVIVQDALVIRVGPLPDDDSPQGELILTLAVLPGEATILTWALDAKIPLVIAPVTE